MRQATFAILAACAMMVAWTPLDAQRYLGYRPTNSGGPLDADQAKYDISFYDLTIEVFPEDRAIAGTATVHARATTPLEWFVLDLDHRMEVSAVEADLPAAGWRETRFVREKNRIRVHLGSSRQPGDDIAVRIQYRGQPKVAPAPPWVGGFTWAQSADGSPWIATSMQFDGGDLWWPCKDHPSDEPDSLRLHVTLPADLVLASNGRLEKVEDLSNNRKTWHWFVSTPINNYNVALNIGPYRMLKTTYRSTAGDEIPVTFYALPEHMDKARAVFPQLNAHLAFYEKYLGPYPFRADKYAVVETPHLGMEHQTVIAYGRYRQNAWGYDDLHHHELGHEWWGNQVTALDWRDFWIHEGFCAYMQALYNEELAGSNAYHAFFEGTRPLVRNITTVAPREPTSTNERYFVAPEFIESDGDIYTKGALVLHTMRYLLGKDILLKGLRRFAYPTAELERATDGTQCRFVTTDDFLVLMEALSGKDLDWFFEVYLRQPVLPRLDSRVRNGNLELSWYVPGGLAFPMPVDVEIGGEIKRIEMHGNQAVLPLPEGQSYRLDPMKWVYKQGD